MSPRSNVDRKLVLLDVEGADLSAVLAAAAAALAEREGIDAKTVEEALRTEAAQGAAIAVGAGVAIPHARIDIADPLVLIVRTRNPMPLQGPDGVPVDLFFVALAPADRPHEHLTMLSHIARLVRSRILLDGLRRCASTEEALSLLEAAEQRNESAAELRQPATATGSQQMVAPAPGQATAATSSEIVLIEITGERAVDRVLVDLADADLAEAIVVDGQPVRELMANELPLFAGFRDLFGDPAGTRVFFVIVPSDRTGEVLDLVRRGCEQSGCERARVAVMPVRHQWQWKRPEQAASKGH